MVAIRIKTTPWGEIDTKTFEGASRYISETKRGLKRGIKPKLAMENILLTLKG